MLLHLDTNQVQTERFKAQINASEPLKKQLWQQTIKVKIANQAKVLEISNKEGAEALTYLSKKVLSGDTDNREAVAAAYYWKHIFDFKREKYRGSDSMNRI